MEHLPPPPLLRKARDAKGHLCNFFRAYADPGILGGRGLGIVVYEKMIKIVATCHQISYFKAIMHQIRFRLGLRHRPRPGSSQRSPRLADSQALPS